MIDPKDVTIIIPHLGITQQQRGALHDCRKSLYETVPDIKRILVTNGNQQPIHYDDYPEETWINLKEQGQCKAVNAAVATTDTEWIFITNDDMIYAPGWFEKLTDFSGRMFIVGNKLGLAASNFSPRPGGIIEVNDINSIKELTPIMCMSPMLVEPITGAPTFTQYFCGGAGGDFNKEKWLEFASNWAVASSQEKIRTGFNFPLLIKRELWDTIGGYDINYDPWGSNGDSDLQAKIHLAGVQPYQNTNSIVYHFSQTSGTSHPERRSFWEKNWHYFIQKWGFERASSPEVWISKDIINKDKLTYRPSWMGKYGEVV